MVKKHKAYLDKWSIENCGDDFILLGYVTNHSFISDGEYIHASRLLKIDFVKRIAETKNTIYILN